MVIDTGVLVSAFAFGGTPAKAVKKAFAESDLFLSPALLREYRAVAQELLDEGKINALQFEILISGVAAVVSAATVVEPRKRLEECRDPEDNMVLECCLAAHADYLITGDKDLLDIENLSFPLFIVSPSEYFTS